MFYFELYSTVPSNICLWLKLIEPTLVEQKIYIYIYIYIYIFKER